MTRLRCAAYARYSTDKQSPLSISDQIRKCKEFAVSQGWDFLEGHTYHDGAITGATDERTGLASLLRAASEPVRPFDVVLVDDTSRLSRKIADSLRICEQLKFSPEYSGAARRRGPTGESGARETLHGNHAHSGGGELQVERRVELSRGSTFGWCRGPGSHHGATSPSLLIPFQIEVAA